MRLQVNGESTDAPDGVTLTQYLEQSGLNPATVVVERNGDIVPASAFATTQLEAGDTLEILHFVGGG